MEKINIINTHSHVNSLKTIDPKKAVNDCKNQGIVIIVPSSTTTDIFEVDKFVKNYENTYSYTGIYPLEAKTFTNHTLNDMETIIKNNPKVVGIGEIGLDYYWDKSFKELQKEVFIKQIEFANEMNLPINIHTREAYNDTLEILKKHNKNSTAIMHCFSGSPEFAKECVKNNIYISIGGVVTFKNAVKLKQTAQIVPIEYLLLETDDPYLTPEPFRGQENQPIYVKYAAQEIAKLKNTTFEQICAQTTLNALKIFNLE